MLTQVYKFVIRFQPITTDIQKKKQIEGMPKYKAIFSTVNTIFKCYL